MAAIAERQPAHVIGDGEHTVRELVEITNQDPRRGIGHEKVLTRITIDANAGQMVRAQGFGFDDVPPEGERILLVATGNMSTGGISIDRTWEAHEDNVEIAEEAARVVGLDVAGIDFLAPDISLPVRETGGAIVEVNAAPGFRMHTHPTEGEPQYVAKPVIDSLFPQGTPSRIPIVAVTGSNGKTTTTRMIAHIFRGLGSKIGMTSTDGVYIDERLVKRVDASGPKSAQMVLQNPRVDMAIFEVARGGILREGLGLRPQRRGGGAERDGRPSRAPRGRDAGAARRSEAGGRRGGAEDRLGGPERGRPARARDAPAHRRPGDPVLDAGEARVRGSLDPPRPEGHRVGARPARRADGAEGRKALLADRIRPHAAGDVRRQGADDGAERDGGGRRRARGGRPPARHPSGSAFLHDVDLPGPRPTERVRDGRRQGDPGLRPQCGRVGDARGLR